MDLKALNPTKQALSFLDGFKTFAFKGNVIDLAVGVIIGGAFGNLVKSLVDNILMPLIGAMLPGKQGYLGWVVFIGGKPVPFGKFLGDVVNFLIVSAAPYLFIVKFVGWLMDFNTKQRDASPPMTKEQELLREIRDLLKASAGPHNDASL